MAERVGFEPTLEFPLNTLSKRAPSATRPSLPQSVVRNGAPGNFAHRADLGPLFDCMARSAKTATIHSKTKKISGFSTAQMEIYSELSEVELV